MRLRNHIKAKVTNRGFKVLIMVFCGLGLLYGFKAFLWLFLVSVTFVNY